MLFMTRVIEPTRGRILVKLGVSNFGDIPVPPKDYDSIIEGVILKVNPEDEKKYGHWVNQVGYWRKFMDDMRVATLSDGSQLAIVDIDKVMGIAHEE